MDKLELVKSRIGLSTPVKDDYIRAIIAGVEKELTQEKGIRMDDSNAYHLLFVADLCAWRYLNRDEAGAMPEHLKARMKNLFVHAGGVAP